NRETKAKDERRAGRSFGGFDSASRVNREARKGDFSIFKHIFMQGLLFILKNKRPLYCLCFVLQDYEDILLPRDKKCPFLLRLPIGSFGIHYRGWLKL
ncbi:PREDICTED: guard cell S-type anion channel SLAC1-like, partial [Populus euphratica]|uniref:Guard cell S-type anion channel SLAC1-like n=1 Tax=Populus euphratica TaxID=75702 RepID=A0AAJ6UH24_POPEU